MVGLLDLWPGQELTSDPCVLLAAGRTTTSEELEDMLESGNPAIFSSGVSTMGRPCFKPSMVKSQASPCPLGSCPLNVLPAQE